MSPRDRRALRMGGAVIVAGVLALRGIPAAVQHLGGAAAELEARQVRLAVLEADAAGLPGLEDSARVVRDGLVALAPALVGGGTPAAAGAGLAARLTAAADRHRARVLAVTPLPDSARVGTIARVSARLEVETDTPGLAGILDAIAADPGALRIVGLRVSALDPVSSDAAAEVLRIAVTVTGWYAEGSGS